MQSPIVAKVIRGETVESVFRGHFIAIDGDGETVESFGDSDIVTYYRSACKAIQAMPFITTGAFDHFAFSDEELALAAASHSGEPRHVRVAALMLERLGLSESYLRCGAHLPFNERESERILRANEYPTQLHNNCSGKHAAMLAVAKHLDADLATYEAVDHPVQREILDAIAAFSEVSRDSIAIGIDGCAAPNFAVPLVAMARSFKNLIAPSSKLDAKYRDAAPRLVSAMMRFPELIGGTDRLDTMLMQAVPDSLISKVGADGVWLAAVKPSEKFPKGLALALKIEDGDDQRARPVVAVALLKKFGVLSDEQLPDLSPMPIKNRRDDLVGRIEATLSV